MYLHINVPLQYKPAGSAECRSRLIIIIIPNPYIGMIRALISFRFTYDPIYYPKYTVVSIIGFQPRLVPSHRVGLASNASQ